MRKTDAETIVGETFSLARSVGDLTATREEYLGDVLQSGKHLPSLINDVLDFSKGS